MILKADPAEARCAARAHAEITPGYHMDKKHWITCSRWAIDEDLVDELVTDSYRLVVEGLPSGGGPWTPRRSDLLGRDAEEPVGARHLDSPRKDPRLFPLT